MIDTNKAREYAELLLLFEGQPSADELKINAGRMLLALADAHDSMAKNDARYRWMAQGGCPFAETDDAWDSKESLDAAIDAAMGAEQRSKDG